MKSTADIRVGSPWSARRNPNTPAMKFVILGFDGPEGEAKRKVHRPAHLARMEPLDAQGRVVLAGPLTDKTGSLIVIAAEAAADAEAVRREEPSTVNGVFGRWGGHTVLPG